MYGYMESAARGVDLLERMLTQRFCEHSFSGGDGINALCCKPLILSQTACNYHSNFSIEFLGNSHKRNKSNKTEVPQTVLFGHSTFC